MTPYTYKVCICGGLEEAVIVALSEGPAVGRSG
jgi:hypothetical protein